eukprot:137716_1
MILSFQVDLDASIIPNDGHCINMHPYLIHPSYTNASYIWDLPIIAPSTLHANRPSHPSFNNGTYLSSQNDSLFGTYLSYKGIIHSQAQINHGKCHIHATIYAGPVFHPIKPMRLFATSRLSDDTRYRCENAICNNKAQGLKDSSTI